MNRDKVNFPAEVERTLKEWRGASSGNDRGERFIVISYQDPQTLKVVSQGEGGWDAASAFLQNDEASYVLLRKIHQVELALTVKFVYIDWTPETIRPLRKAALSLHKSPVEGYLKPHHVSFQISSKSDLNEQQILARIGFASGTAVHYKDATENKKPSTFVPRVPSNPSVVARPPPDTRASPVTLRISNEDEFKAAIRDVRDDSTPTTWMAACYADKNTLTFTRSGSGDVEAMLAQFDDSNVCFGLIRVVQVIDKSNTTKFVYVKCQPTSVPPMKRAAINTQKGAIDSLFSPYHVDFFIESKTDLSSQIVADKVADAAGHKSRVIDRK